MAHRDPRGQSSQLSELKQTKLTEDGVIAEKRKWQAGGDEKARGCQMTLGFGSFLRNIKFMTAGQRNSEESLRLQAGPMLPPRSSLIFVFLMCLIRLRAGFPSR